MMIEAARSLGVAVTYDGLRKLIAARRKELGLSQLALDEMAGVQTGYTGKIECGDRMFGDLSLNCILGALGLGLSVVLSTAKQSDIIKISEVSVSLAKNRQKKIGAKGGRVTARNSTPEWRRKRASKGGKVRWHKWREAKAERERREKQASRRAKQERTKFNEPA